MIYVCILSAFVFLPGELNDKVPRTYWGNAGEGNAAIDPDAVTRDGEPNTVMITKVTIGYFEYEGVKDIRWCIFLVYFSFNRAVMP